MKRLIWSADIILWSMMSYTFCVVKTDCELYRTPDELKHTHTAQHTHIVRAHTHQKSSQNDGSHMIIVYCCCY